MKKRLYLWQLGGLLFSSALGTLLHFLYELTEIPLFAPIASVNESTWEHMKLLFVPLFAFALIQSRFFKERADYWCIKLVGTAAGLLLIPVLFYTLNGAFGKTPDWVNISIFFIVAAAVYLLETALFKAERVLCDRAAACLLIFCVIAAFFVLFTYLPPEIPLFMDPITGNFGII